jgi:hypothetical protein
MVAVYEREDRRVKTFDYVKVAQWLEYRGSAHKSNVAKRANIPFASISDSSNAWTHLTAAMVCFTEFLAVDPDPEPGLSFSTEDNHTRPLTPVAASSGNCAPRRGRRKCVGERRLAGVDVRCT